MKIIITGAYAIGTHLARLLSRNHEDITIIDKDPDRLAQIGSDYDLMTVEASPESISMGKSRRVISPSHTMSACSMAFIISRTLPGCDTPPDSVRTASLRPCLAVLPTRALS